MKYICQIWLIEIRIVIKKEIQKIQLANLLLVKIFYFVGNLKQTQLQCRS